MNKEWNDKIWACIAMLMMILFIILLIRGCTSSENWYVGEHDSQCEIMRNGGDFEKDKCGCYERLLEADRKRVEKQNK